MHSVSAFTDYFVICHGGSSSQVQAITGNIERTLRSIKVRADHIEGDVSTAAWILMDYGDFIVHIFNEASREYYSLEKLWLDAPQIDFEDYEENSSDMGRQVEG